VDRPTAWHDGKIGGRVYSGVRFGAGNRHPVAGNTWLGQVVGSCFRRVGQDANFGGSAAGGKRIGSGLTGQAEASASAADSRPMATPPSRPRHPRLAAAQAQGRWTPLEIAPPPAVVPEQAPSSEFPEVENATSELPVQKRTESVPETFPAPISEPGPLIRQNVARVTREDLLQGQPEALADSIKPINVLHGRRREISPVEGAGTRPPHEQGSPDLGISPPGSAGVRSRAAGDRVRVGFGITLPRVFVGIIGFVVSGLLGLAIGYWLVSKLFPESWILRPW